MITSDNKKMVSPSLLHLESLKTEAVIKLNRLYREALKKRNGFLEKHEKGKIFSDILSELYSEYSYNLGFVGNPGGFRSVIIKKKNDLEKEERISFQMPEKPKETKREPELPQKPKAKAEVLPELFSSIETGAGQIKLKQKREKIEGIFSPEFNSKKRARFSRREEKETTF